MIHDLPHMQLLAIVTMALSLLINDHIGKVQMCLAARYPIACLTAGFGRSFLPGGAA